jgi:hypothetical protein
MAETDGLGGEIGSTVPVADEATTPAEVGSDDGQSEG